MKIDPTLLRSWTLGKAHVEGFLGTDASRSTVGAAAIEVFAAKPHNYKQSVVRLSVFFKRGRHLHFIHHFNLN